MVDSAKVQTGSHTYEVVYTKDKVDELIAGVGSVPGPQGPQGIQGAQGETGPNAVTTATTTNITGILKGNGANVSQAVAGTDYAAASHTQAISTVTGLQTALDGKQATLSNAATLAKVTESGGSPLWDGGTWPSSGGDVTKAQFQEATGYGVISGLGVTAQGTPNMTVAIAAGVVHMPDGTRYAPSAVASQAINTADATNPRKDIIYVNSSGAISYTAGTPGASPSAPATPAGAVLLAEIYVAANDTAINTADITDKRAYKARYANRAEVNVKDLGAALDGTTDDSPVLQFAINNYDIIYIPKGTLKLAASVTIPQARNIEIYGDGYRTSKIHAIGGIVGLNYIRDSTSGGTTLTLKDLQLAEVSYGKTSVGIKFHGYSTVLHDNWLRMTDCSVYGFQSAVSLKFAGQCHFTRIFGMYSTNMFYMERDASFIYFNGCMSMGNSYFIYGDDTLADGISNGIFVTNCHSVTNNNIDIRLVGWQAVWIVGGGYDLGSGGQAAIYMGSCSDYHILSSWIASDLGSAPTRIGIQLYQCNGGSIADTSIANNQIGIRIDGAAGYSDKVSIHDCLFAGNTNNDIFVNAGRVIKFHGNTINSTPNRTGVNYEVYFNTGGTDYNIIRNNSFRQSTYTISAGTNSVVVDNMFGVPA